MPSSAIREVTGFTSTSCTIRIAFMPSVEDTSTCRVIVRSYGPREDLGGPSGSFFHAVFSFAEDRRYFGSRVGRGDADLEEEPAPAAGPLEL